HDRQGHIGEFGIPAGDSRLLEAMDNLLAYLQKHCIPMTYWAAGPSWGNYKLSVEPTRDGQERPQWAVLEKYVGKGDCKRIGPWIHLRCAPASCRGAMRSACGLRHWHPLGHRLCLADQPLFQTMGLAQGAGLQVVHLSRDIHLIGFDAEHRLAAEPHDLDSLALLTLDEESSLRIPAIDLGLELVMDLQPPPLLCRGQIEHMQGTVLHAVSLQPLFGFGAIFLQPAGHQVRDLE